MKIFWIGLHALAMITATSSFFAHLADAKDVKGVAIEQERMLRGQKSKGMMGGGKDHEVKYRRYDDKACRTHSGGNGEEGYDYTLYKNKSLSWCKKKCSDNSGCEAFEYYARDNQCEIWWKYDGDYELKGGFQCYHKCPGGDCDNL
jgi:hypothetical protein